LQRAARLTVRERLEALESMADTSARLSDIRDEHTVRPVSPNPDPATNEIIREMVDRIVSRFHPLRVIVFGSRARGTAHAGSDVDLLVVFADVKNKRQTTIEIRRALGDLPLSKDVIVTTPAELALRGELVGSVLRSALLEGQVVYDRP
ncbi:MAG: nucleotidyltransferase domain-containing protein, partial [Vicinamibacterales bacterium]